MGKQAPPGQDYKAAASQSSQSSRPNTSNPFASTTWTTGPNGQATASQQLSPEMQAMFANLGPAPTGDAAREQAITSAYNSATRGLDPHFRRTEEALDTKLANQGLPASSAAGRGASRELAAQKGNAYSQAMADAIRQGTAAQDTTFRQNMMARNMPIQDAMAMQGLLGGLNYGQGADFLGAAGLQGNMDLQRWMAENKANADMVKGGVDAAGSLASLFMLSDERLKAKVRRLAEEVIPGVPVALWEWPSMPGVTQRGVIAQDVRKVAPHLVMTTPGGHLAVDYAGLMKEAAHGPRA